MNHEVHEARLVSITPDAEEQIVYMARVSNPANQNNMETAPRLIKYLLKHKHFSPFEMATMQVEINTTRAIAAQILRHRSASYQEFCLAGNARVTVSNGSGYVTRMPIEDLYQKWGKPSFKSRYARSYDDSVGRFIEAPILSVYESGEKPVYRFQIGKRSIDCTREHRVLTQERGFVDFGEAYDNGLTVALNGATAEPLPYQDPKVLADNAWMGSTRFAKEFGIKEVTARKWFRKCGVTPYNPNNAPRSAIDASFNARKTSFMKWARANVRKDSCEVCGHDGSTSRLELSHVVAHDGDPALCFDEGNLQTLCASCHRQHDIEMQGKHFGWTLGMTAKWGKIDSQTYLGVQMTYDIEMDHPTHNFVADGIVVHNSQRYSSVGDLPPIGLPHLRTQDLKNKQASHDNLDEETKRHLEIEIDRLYKSSQDLYNYALSKGVAKECARSILPLGTPTRMYMSMTIRTAIHYCQIRCGEETQLEHRMIACDIRDIIKEQLPNVHQAVFG